MVKRAALWGILLLAAAVGGSEARTWNVRKDGTGDYMVIQDAVDQAAAGDTVRIGPGRYEEKRPYTSYPTSPDKWTFDVYVAVDVTDLTIIGAGAGQTIIGPPAPIWQNPQQPKIICALSRVQRLVVEDLSLENVRDGVYRGEHGTLTVSRCETRGCRTGVITWSELGTVLDSCRFQNTDYGVLSFSPAGNVLVQGCSFITCSADFEGTDNAVVSDCKFEGYSVGCQYASGSNGTVNNSTFTGQTNVSVVATTGSTVELVDNSLLGGAANLAVHTNSTVTGSGNTLGGGSFATIRVSSSDVRLHGNHILHGVGPSVRLEAFVSPPIRTLNMINNYWGTDSAETIATWIYDRYDNPAIYGYVAFEPFSGQAITTERQSWGELKRLYKR